MLEELSTSRDLKDVIKEEEMSFQDLTWEDLPSFEIGLEKGIQKGIQKAFKKVFKKVYKKAFKKVKLKQLRH